MFKKLISNLPFNPSLIAEVSFYAKRIHNESSVRRTGVMFMVLAMLIQLFAIVSPPEATLAESSNDIIRGGFTSREQATNYCRSNTQSFADILSYHGIDCEKVASASIQTIKSTDYNKQLRSMGRNPQGSKIVRTGKETNETTVRIGGKNYYMRNLWSWDSGSYSSYKVLVMKNAHGQTIFILYNCGNIATIGTYSPPVPQTPKPVPQKPLPPTDVCPNVPGLQLTQDQCDVCPNVPGIQTNQNECYPCPAAKNDTAITACMKMKKTASNKTQNITNANGTVAHPNDIIIYTITSENHGNQDIKDFIVEENMSDVLEYADIVDLGGGSIDESNKTVVWPKENIVAGTTLSNTITVKIKDPIPQTPVSTSDKGSFDMVMTNVYFGSSVDIKLPPSIVKTTELTVQSLPETGPGTALTAGFAITAIFSYFFARSRLLAKELDIVKSDFVTSGSV